MGTNGDKPTISDMERVLKKHFPHLEEFPLLRTLSSVAWELSVSRRDLLRTLKDPRKVLWYRGGKIYVPPDVYLRWKQTLNTEDLG
jgi:hypothetical protein